MGPLLGQVISTLSTSSSFSQSNNGTAASTLSEESIHDSRRGGIKTANGYPSGCMIYAQKLASLDKEAEQAK